MSETLRDLVVSLSLNSDNFTRNIKSINKQIQEAESAFRLASAGVENFETTTAGLSSKLSTLQRTFQLQQDAVGQYERALQQKAVAEYEKALAAAKEQLQAAQQVNDPDKIREATDAVQDAETALNNARAAVKQTQADIASCNKELKTAQSEWSKAGVCQNRGAVQRRR